MTLRRLCGRACESLAPDCTLAGIMKTTQTRASFGGRSLAEKFYAIPRLLRSVFVLIAKLLIVIPPALVAAGKRFFYIHSGILPLHIFKSGIHLA